MNRYGVKTKGRVVWILADDVQVEEGVILFTRKPSGGSGEANEVVAGFNVASIDHFGRPDAFAKEATGDSAG